MEAEYEYDGPSVVLLALGATLFTWGATALGAAAVFLLEVYTLSEKTTARVLDSTMGFSAGVMLAASFWSLLEPSIEIAAQSETYGPDGRWSWVPAVLGFLAGGAAIYAADDMLHRLGVGAAPVEEFVKAAGVAGGDGGGAGQREPASPGGGARDGQLRRRGAVDVEANAPYYDDDDDEGRKKRSKGETWRRALLLTLAITAHNVPEGLCVGVAIGAVAHSSAATMSGAVLLTLGMALQNAPEGAAVSLPLRRAGLPPWQCFMYGQLSGAVEPVGGLLGVLAVSWVTPILPYALSFAAGAMVYVVVHEVVPEGAHGPNKQYATSGAMVGFVVMMALDVALSP